MSVGEAGGLSPKTQQSDTDSLKNVMTTKSKLQDQNLNNDILLSSDSAVVIDIVSKILNSVGLSETIGIMEKSITEKDYNLHRGEVQTKDQIRKAKSCKKMSTKTVYEFQKVTNVLSEMRKNNKALDKKLSLEKICQMLEEMRLQDCEATELSYISALRELALETDIVIKKLQKLRKCKMSEGDIVAKVAIMSPHGFEKTFKFLRIFIKRFYKDRKHRI